MKSLKLGLISIFSAFSYFASLAWAEPGMLFSEQTTSPGNLREASDIPEPYIFYSHGLLFAGKQKPYSQLLGIRGNDRFDRSRHHTQWQPKVDFMFKRK